MHVASTALLAALTFGQPAVANAILDELLSQGIRAADGTTVRLSPPFLSEGLDAAGQRQAIEKALGGKTSFDEFTRRSLQAPVLVNLRALPVKDGIVRVLDVGFIVYGDWGQIQSEQFLEGLLRSAQEEAGGGTRAGPLPPAALAQRKIVGGAPSGSTESYFASRANLLDRVEVATTRRSIARRGADSLLVASKVDPRFANDPEYPNQWRPLEVAGDGSLKAGEAVPYEANGFYAQAVRLAEPAGAIFVEYHMAFEEPRGWFNGGQQLRSKLPLLVQDEAKRLRRRLGD